MMHTRDEVSAGGVVYRRDGEQLQILICKHSGYHKWVLPKGLIEAGETVEAAALREVEEEGGVRAKIIAPLGKPEEYTYTLGGILISKKVYYFLMEYIQESPSGHDFEMEAVEWVNPDEAIDRMGFHAAKDVIRRSLSMLER